jgi:diguanylate cyclase
MTTYLLALFVGLAQLALGFAVGVWWVRRANPPDDGDDDADDDRWLREIMHRCHELAANVKADVGQYHQRIAATHERLSTAATDKSGGDDRATSVMEVVTGIVAEVLELNGKLENKLAAAEEQLQLQSGQIESYLSEARTDGLTGLLNRRAFDDELRRRHSHWIRRGHPTGLLLIDVDHFKQLNDRYGHPAGDTVLTELGVLLTRTMREMDLVARYGGEEFAVVLPDTDAAGAKLAAERARAAVETAIFRHSDQTLTLTVSIGAADLVTGDDVNRLIRRADQALYTSKSAGRNCGHYHNGQWCEPITNPDAAAIRTSPPVVPPSIDGSALGPELADACESLRQRLTQLTAESADSASRLPA